jgi:hypothetical protein
MAARPARSTPSTTRSRAKAKAAPETTSEDKQVIDTDPVGLCDTCTGFGLVRGEGKRAGGPYRTQNGAQQALANGRAKDCPTCGGTGAKGLVA